MSDNILRAVIIIAVALVAAIGIARADQYVYERGNIIGILDTDPPSATLTIADKQSSVHAKMTCDMIGVGTSDSAVVTCGDAVFVLVPGSEHGYISNDPIQMERKMDESCHAYYNPFSGWSLTCVPQPPYVNPFIPRGQQ